MKKKILFIVPSLATGGVERELVTISNALADCGNDVTVLMLFYDDTLKPYLNNKVKLVYKPLKTFFVRQKIPVIKDKYYGMCMWETRASAKALYRYYLGKSNFDVEIAFFRGLPVKIISGSTNMNSIKLAWVHSDFKRCKEIDFCFENRNDTINAYGNFNKIVCVSGQVKESFNQVIGYSDKTEVIYNAIPIDEIISKSKEQCPLEKTETTVVSVGRLAEPKAFDRLLCAVDTLNNRGYKFELWLIGDGEKRESLEKFISEHNLYNVKLLGKRDNPYAFMKKADIYICSSLWEGFPLTVIEALACSLPVVSTNCTGPTEALDSGKYGLLVENNTEGILNGLETMLKDENIRKKYSETAFQRAGAFDVEPAVNKILNLIEKQ